MDLRENSHLLKNPIHASDYYRGSKSAACNHSLTHNSEAALTVTFDRPYNTNIREPLIFSRHYAFEESALKDRQSLRPELSITNKDCE